MEGVKPGTRARGSSLTPAPVPLGDTEMTTQTTSTHTTGPWTVKPYGYEWHIYEPNPDAGKAGVSYSGDSLMVATVYDELDAARIASEHNAHPALLAALEAVKFHDDHEDCLFCDTPEGEDHDPGATCSLILAAIRAARGEE